MSMSTGGDSGGVTSEINVTPLVDVMLVLLIIVMLVAPLVQQGAPLTLPTARNTADHPETSEQTTVAVTADSRFWVNGTEVLGGDAALGDIVEESLESKSDRLVLIKADLEAPYGDVMAAMDVLRGVGIEDMALITDDEQGGGQ